MIARPGMREPGYLYLCLTVSAATFVGWPLLFEHSEALEAVGSSELIWWGAQRFHVHQADSPTLASLCSPAHTFGESPEDSSRLSG